MVDRSINVGQNALAGNHMSAIFGDLLEEKVIGPSDALLFGLFNNPLLLNLLNYGLIWFLHNRFILFFWTRNTLFLRTGNLLFLFFDLFLVFLVGRLRIGRNGLDHFIEQYKFILLG